MIRRNIRDRIQQYFFLNPTTKLRVRQIERVVKVPLPSAIRYTKELEREGITKRSEIANVTTYSADRNSTRFLLEKKLFNIQQLFLSGLVDFLIEELSNPAIVVFGSYSRGEDIETSDIDIYIETPSKKKLNLEKFERALQRKIQVFIHKNIRDVENKELANAILNGVMLHGFIEVFE
ncbi:nucleotidyltransferase domain-containing protein [Candidatus Woesearchaeota archaeon]|nr:nucleotidyltransferase domain-containing protein [Candidatus Woesearchaeota archaeon]